VEGGAAGNDLTGVLEGWQFRVDVVAGGLRISASAPGGSDPAVWVVTAAGNVTEAG